MSAEFVEPAVPAAKTRIKHEQEGPILAKGGIEQRDSLRWNWHDAVYVLFLVCLVVVIAWVYTPNFGGEVAGNWWDPLLNTWTLAWDTNTLLHAPTHLWQGQLLYPNDLTLSYSENLLGEAIFFAPFYLLSHNPVLAYNITFYATFLLCSITMYIAARYYTRKPLAAFVAALVYTYAPYRISQIDHIHVVAGEWIPLAFLYLDLALQKGRWRHWSLFSLFYLLQILSSIYYGIFLSYTLLAYVLIRYGWPFFQRFRREREQYILQVMKQALRPLLTLSIAGVVLFILLKPYLASLRNGFVRSTMQTAGYSAFIRDFLYTIPFNRLHGVASSHGVTLPLDGEHFLFLGWTTMALTLLGVFLAWRLRDSVMGCFALSGLIVLLFSFGPYLQYSTWSGAPLLPTQPYSHPFPPGIPMPWLLAYYILPGFKGLRVPSRLVGVLVMMLALLSAYAIAWVQERMLDRDGVGRLGIIVVRCALVLVPLALLAEALPAYVPTTQVPTGKAIPAVYQWLAGHADNGPVVELPMAHFDENFKVKQEAWYDYYAIYHTHPLVDGWSGYRPDATVAISQSLLSFPAEGSLTVLQKIHVEYVVFHPALFLAFESQNAVAATVAQMQTSPHLHFIAVFGSDPTTSDTIWQVT